MAPLALLFSVFYCLGLLNLFCFFFWCRLWYSLLFGVFPLSHPPSCLFCLVCLLVFCFGALGTLIEPWIGLYCSELHLHCPVELSTVQSRVPASSKVCQHGSYGADVMQ